MKRILTCVALADLLLARVWRSLVFTPYGGYHLPNTPTLWDHLAALALLVSIAAGFWLLWSTIVKCRRPWLLSAGRWLFLTLVALALNSVLSASGITMPSISSGLVAMLGYLVAAVCLVTAVFLIRGRSTAVAKWLQILVLLTLPFTAITAGRSALFVSGLTVNESDGATVRRDPPSRDRPKLQRVVWIVFDEFDRSAAFDHRPDGLSLPELDRFASGSLFAENALPPSYETLRSIPALITGRMVNSATPRSPFRLSLDLDGDTEPKDWRHIPNVFTATRDLGGKVGIVGWYHPYCRIYSEQVDRCVWRSNYPDSVPGELTGQFRSSIRLFALMTGRSIPLVREILPKFTSYNANFAAMTRDLENEATTYAADADLDLVFLHIPSPHPPWIYDPTTEMIDPHHTGTYYESLQYADSVLGKIRMAMEASGSWESSVVIVTSDHWWRTGRPGERSQSDPGGEPDHRIPFMIKAAVTDPQPVRFEQEFNTVQTKDLIDTIRSARGLTNTQIADSLQVLSLPRQ